MKTAKQQQEQEKKAATEAAELLFDMLKNYPWFIGVLLVKAHHTGIYGIYELRVFSRDKKRNTTKTVPNSFQGLPVQIYAEPDAEEVWKKLSAKKSENK